jgi:PhnB protein
MPERSLFDRLNEAVEDLLTRSGAGSEPKDRNLAALLEVAAELRELPRVEFRKSLRASLERITAMTAIAEPVVKRSRSAVPYLILSDAAEAIEFYKQAFGARETFRLADRGKIGHAEIMIGDATIMLCDEYPDYGAVSPRTLGGSPVKLHLEVEDVDSFTQRAVAAGARLERPVKDEFYGERVGQVTDPFGYTWIASTLKEELTPEEVARRFETLQVEEGAKRPAEVHIPPGYRTLTPYIVAQDAPVLIDFVRQVFGGEKTLQTIGSAGGIHAEVKVGDSLLMIGGGGPELRWRGDSKPGAFHIYVPDCDAAYERALHAGAASIDQPADRPYGERSAAVKDASGNHWYIATGMGASYKPEGVPDIQPCLHPLRAEPVLKFLRSAFRANELERYASPDGVIHHLVAKIGDSRIEMGEAHGPYQPLASMFYVYVADCDAAYRRALAAGATSLAEPKDQAYGDRSAGVTDPFGNQWYMATPKRDVATQG